jgi:AraC-like DNA-binding protein
MTFIVGADDPLYPMIVAKSGHVCSAEPFTDSIRFICDVATLGVAYAEYIIKNRAFEVICLMCGGMKNEKRRQIRNVLSKDGDIRLFKAKRFIEDNAQLYLGCEDVASYVGISSKQLSRIFVKYEKISLRNYIQKKKAEEAVRMLEETDLPIALISDGLGFSGVCYFNNFFVRHFGVSPGKYRKNKRKM